MSREAPADVVVVLDNQQSVQGASVMRPVITAEEARKEIRSLLMGLRRKERQIAEDTGISVELDDFMGPAERAVWELRRSDEDKLVDVLAKEGSATLGSGEGQGGIAEGSFGGGTVDLGAHRATIGLVADGGVVAAGASSRDRMAEAGGGAEMVNNGRMVEGSHLASPVGTSMSSSWSDEGDHSWSNSNSGHEGEHDVVRVGDLDENAESCHGTRTIRPTPIAPERGRTTTNDALDRLNLLDPAAQLRAIDREQARRQAAIFHEGRHKSRPRPPRPGEGCRRT